MRVAFAVVVACHVPYIFFYGKEACCIVVDELMNGSTSAQLQQIKSDDEEEPPAYLSMRPALYYGVTFALYVLVIFGANLTDNLGIILDYLSALSISGMQFFVPGLCFIKMANKGNIEDKSKRLLSYFFCGFSILVTTTILYNNLFG